MPAAVATSEPDSVTAGETIAWIKALADYPASSFTLKYALQRAGADLISITSTASGAAHAVLVAATASLLWTPGPYVWTSFTEGAGSTRYTVERGIISVLASPLAALGSTHATRTLALIEAALEGRIPRGLESTNIDGQQLDRMPIADLEKLQVRYKFKVQGEETNARIAAGLGNRRQIFGRFTRAT
jgi:hypothetical protein